MHYLVTESKEESFTTHSFIHSVTLPGIGDAIVTRQNKAPAFSDLVEGHEIWGRWTRTLPSAPVFTIQMISPFAKLSEPQFPWVSDVRNDAALI